MSDLDDLRRQVEQLREQVQMEAGLRASRDTDLSRIATRLDAARHLVQAVALTQSAHEEILRDHTDRLVQLEQKLDTLDEKTTTNLQVIIGQLNTLVDDNGA
ncbi:hypothetical protein HH310_31290 [Actinoplanes sp. TBRC 11911]|uniref:hypothetical protein n=1 Tax=Actinoplanes sp. TBRC 11911 TaxID=2729386 RepID=UPI00145D098A|nr:hypothetical protein [Actinoplanes sp. TBRC 11911]NMO55655.1 hypothetical protein [Actinoplanes sp. TBRC 11911]